MILNKRKKGHSAPWMVSVEFADYGFDTPHTCGGALLLEDLESLEFTRVGDVRPSAEFLGDIADDVDLDHIAVFAVEHSDRSRCLCLFLGHLLAYDGDILLDGIVDVFGDLLQLLHWISQARILEWVAISFLWPLRIQMLKS